MFKIEKGVPIPQETRTNNRYPWSDMETGDSFFVVAANQRPMSSTAHAAGKRLGKKFVTGKENGGVRIWRVA